MSSTEQGGNSISRTATKAATLIDQNLHRGADAVSNIARQTSDFVHQQGQKIKRQASNLGETATQHPAYTLLIVGAVGFTLGYLCRGTRNKV